MQRKLGFIWICKQRTKWVDCTSPSLPVRNIFTITLVQKKVSLHSCPEANFTSSYISCYNNPTMRLWMRPQWVNDSANTVRMSYPRGVHSQAKWGWRRQGKGIRDLWCKRYNFTQEAFLRHQKRVSIQGGWSTCSMGVSKCCSSWLLYQQSSAWLMHVLLSPRSYPQCWQLSQWLPLFLQPLSLQSLELMKSMPLIL